MTNHRWIPLVILIALTIFAMSVGQPRPDRQRRADRPRRHRLAADRHRARAADDARACRSSTAGWSARKNVISTMLQSFIALGVVSLLWVVVGFSLCFGDSFHGLIGDPRTYFMFRGVGGATHPDLAPTIPLVAVRDVPAEVRRDHAGAHHRFVRRARALLGLPVFMCLFSDLHLLPARALDVASAGVPAAVGRARLRRRHGRAHVGGLRGARRRDRSSGRRRSHDDGGVHAPANIPYVLLGTGMLWFGWFGFNAGSALGGQRAPPPWPSPRPTPPRRRRCWRGCCSTWRADRRPSALGACIGAVVGLVAITPAAGFVSIAHSIFIGVAGEPRQQLGRALEVAVDARRHARRVPLPRRRRHRRHAR